MKLTHITGLTAVALSGGADSVSLLRLLLEAGCDVVALHCNFHLRGQESDRDETFVRDLCARLQVPLHVKDFDTEQYAREKGVSLEMAARELRYEWFEGMRRELGCAHVAVAHHMEDQAETVLLNLVRGTGLRGLAGMRERNGNIVRPLLRFTKADILAYLEEIGQDYVTDSTNMEANCQRNKLRLQIIPLLREINPKAVEHVCQAADRVGDCMDGKVSEYESLKAEGFTDKQTRMILNGVSPETFTQTVQATQPVAIRYDIVETDKPLEFVKTQTLDRFHAYIDADGLQLPLTERVWAHGDRFHPFGMRGTRLVSDFLTDLKLDRREKDGQRLLLSAGEVVWVVGRRADDRFKVTAQTRRVGVFSILV